jgi:hypothetical protein
MRMKFLIKTNYLLSKKDIEEMKSNFEDALKNNKVIAIDASMTVYLLDEDDNIVAKL